MTLDEAIKHCKEKAEELRLEAEQLRDIGERISSPKQPYNEPVKNCRDCAEEYEQLAEWLEELKEWRKLKEEQRPQGEWIDHSEDYDYVECPFCHKLTNCEGNPEELHYCWNCGALMTVSGNIET